MPRDWTIQAACRGYGVWGFHSDSSADQHLAIRIYCAFCPVREACRDTAEQHESSRGYGVWGGTTSDQREKQRKQLRAQRAVA
jgi:hypothetical protein